ncbi:lysozyme [Altererythrobacter aquiaggeris]|uniref:lysozyme n=1 Tax=Aestuarierythrobacter aquiaggeris TaxID=1898396 RepID=UPI0030186C61
MMRTLLSRQRAGLKRKRAALLMSAGAVSLTAATDLPSAFLDGPSLTSEAEAVRKSATALSASDKMKMALIEEEGVRADVYLDAAGRPTVGAGHQVTRDDNLSVGQNVSRDQIMVLLERDLAIAEASVRRLVGDLVLYQHEFDALVDLAFNVGEGKLAASESPRLNAAVALADYRAIADELGYHNAGGFGFDGLIHRSKRRAAIFLDADYSDTRNSGAIGPATRAQRA